MLFPVFNIAGMMLDNFTSESVPVDMCIDFSGGDGFMSQHALDGPQIGAAFQQMGGEGVAERMGTDILGDAGFFCQLFYHVKHHDAGDIIAPIVPEIRNPRILSLFSPGCGLQTNTLSP